METNDYFANMRNHDEMLAEAKKIHPDMRVRLIDQGECKWEMYMPTPYTGHISLNEKYKGTEAWNYYESRDAGYDNELERYRYKQGYSHLPIEGVAEIINLKHEQHVWAAEVAEQLHAENGSGITNEQWQGEVTNEQFTAYTATQRKVAGMMETEFSAKWDALREKWEF
jgi:hypothetical protein